MAGLVWRETADGYVSGIYRISRISARAKMNWLLEITAEPTQDAPAASPHRTLRGALASAQHHEVARVRRLRLQRNVAVGAAAALALVALAPYAGSLAGYIATICLLGIAVREVGQAIEVGLGEAVRITWFDRVVASVLRSLRGVPQQRPGNSAQPAIRILPPTQHD